MSDGNEPQDVSLADIMVKIGMAVGFAVAVIAVLFLWQYMDDWQTRWKVFICGLAAVGAFFVCLLLFAIGGGVIEAIINFFRRGTR